MKASMTRTRDIVFQAIGKQRCLAAILAFDKTLHSGPRKSLAKAYLIQAFSHSLDPKGNSYSRAGVRHFAAPHPRGALPAVRARKLDGRIKTPFLKP